MNLWLCLVFFEVVLSWEPFRVGKTNLKTIKSSVQIHDLFLFFKLMLRDSSMQEEACYCNFGGGDVWTLSIYLLYGGEHQGGS